ncbi:MAG: geranylgeranyl diphosphate synthase type II [Hyphomicrobiaceae bacterium]|jgi:geranylgeranyl diphosphate synthase type II
MAPPLRPLLTRTTRLRATAVQKVATERLLASIEDELRGALPLQPTVADATDAVDAVEKKFEDEFGAARLIESMVYSLSTPGKRIRPLLLLATVELLGGDLKAALPFGVGLEMIHAYSLIHDDLPAMDDDDLRRGRPTNHRVYGDGMAILAGDGLLTEALVVMLEAGVSPGLGREVALMIARAAGREGMVGGQAADLLAETEKPQEETLRSIHRRKTGALLEVAVVAGARLAAADPDDARALSDFGTRYGLAFQIADDVKDEIAPEAVTGKKGGGDRSAGKMTYPALFGIERSLELCRNELAAAQDALHRVSVDTELLSYIAVQSIEPALAGRDS